MRRLLLAAVLAALAWGAWLHETRLPLRAWDAPPETLVIEPGASVETIARQLAARGLVRHPLVFRALVRAHGKASALKAGEYVLDGPMTLTQILEMLTRGDVLRRDVTFPEGKRIEELAEIAELRADVPRAEFLKAARDATPIRDLDPMAKDLEGYLFPDTYDVPRVSASGAALVARMVERFRDVIEPELKTLPERGLSVRELVTLASVVEMETGRADERPRIAAVFLNRLKKKMPLQTDPTVIYALRLAGTYDGNIRKKDLSIDSPYNTYKYAGLPPGPIAAPGREALLAVLHPAQSEDLFFVSRNDGSHQFSRTLAEHERAVDQYQRRRPRKSG